MSHTQFYPLNPWFPKLWSFVLWYHPKLVQCNTTCVKENYLGCCVSHIHSSAPWIILIDCEKRRRVAFSVSFWPTDDLSGQQADWEWGAQGAHGNLWIAWSAFLSGYISTQLPVLITSVAVAWKKPQIKIKLIEWLKLPDRSANRWRKGDRRTPQAMAGLSLDPVQRLVKTGSRDCFLFCSKCSTAEAERYQIAIFETAAGSLYSLQPNQNLYQATFYNVQV